jgi:26S proteasome regulatory subunit N8
MSQTEAILHPLCLLSVVDHFNRVAKDFASRRVVGVLLGSRKNGTVDIANSFGVPFEEKNNEPDVWFLDHNYLETMYRMFRKVNNKEELVGFYSTGPLLKKNDLKIRSLIKRFMPNAEPIFIIIDVRPNVEGIPTTAYEAQEEVNSTTREISWVFKHISCIIEAEESEAVGVEHLVRDINDPSTSTLALQIQQKINGLSGLVNRLSQIREYIEKVLSNEYPVNNKIIYNIQNIVNLLPNMNIGKYVTYVTSYIYMSIYT